MIEIDRLTQIDTHITDIGSLLIEIALEDDTCEVYYSGEFELGLAHLRILLDAVGAEDIEDAIKVLRLMKDNPTLTKEFVDKAERENIYQDVVASLQA